MPWLNDGLRSARLKVGADDLRGLLLHKCFNEKKKKLGTFKKLILFKAAF